jgi:oligoendopeptidase F
MSLDNEKTNIDQNIKLHLQEAEDMKKQWFSYVYQNIDRLSRTIETTAIRVEQERVEVLERLNKLREELNVNIRNTSGEQSKQLEKAEIRLNKTIEALSVKVGSLSISDVRLQIDEYVQGAKEKIDKSILKLRDETNKQLKILNDSNIEMKTKIKIYAIMYGLIVTAIASTVAGAIIPALLAFFSGG